ncbi:MAG: hypothetical protein KatS3mg024_2048 [Armatimonadota bacterium]|nr:MAG: hypothetical protein KatS3mg024_2048 [Armatimonadota bacterium]
MKTQKVIATNRRLMRLCLFLAALNILTLKVCSASYLPVSVSASGTLGYPPYDDPLAALHRPSLYVQDPGFPPFVPPAKFAVSMVYSAWGTGASGEKLIVTLREGASLTAEFNPPLMDDPANWYGKDFLVFGNSFFGASAFVQADSDMELISIRGSEMVSAEPMTVSVSQDGVTWYSYSSGPFADSFAPTQAFAWDRVQKRWGPELDFTRPLPAGLTAADFAGLKVADAIDLYRDSAGGTAFDLADLPLPVHPITGRKWARFVRVTADRLDEDGFALEGEVDAFARVSHARPEVSIGSAKLLPDGARVDLKPAIVSAGTFEAGPFCYILSPDRSAGVRVLGRVVPQGRLVSLTGVMETEDGERVLRATSLQDLGETALPAPVALRVSQAGGGPFHHDPATGAGQEGVVGGAGLNTVGLPARLHGKVISVAAQAETFTLDDGSGPPLECRAPRNPDGSGSVHPGFSLPQVGAFVEVAGIISVRRESQGGLKPVLLLRKPADLRLLALP